MTKPCKVCDQFKSTAFTPVSTTKEPSTLECPPDSLELGRSTWTFLHTMAAYYPEQPTPTTQQTMTRFLGDFSKFYPCSYCADHLQDYLEKHPPAVNSNQELSLWMCQVHNEVNERLGKPSFDCSKVFERWKDGC